ncbi:hypothetical protein SLE2022_203980 [Rubroshorea leprosula]
MNRCRELLLDWNAQNIPERIKKLQFDLQQVQDDSASDCSLEHLEAVEKELRDLQKQEEVYWKQRCRVQWLKEGDKNTSFFHTRASERRKKNFISELQSVDGQIVRDQVGWNSLR